MRPSTVALLLGVAVGLFYLLRPRPASIFPPFAMPTEDQPLDPRDVVSRRFAPSLMNPSGELAEWLKRKEKLSLVKYRLGDGGVTIGYGHFEPESRAHLVPDMVTKEWADETFANDLEERGARWVRQYVMTPLQQNEFDALTSLAFNLSPASFSQVAGALNRGEDWREVAKRFVRPDLPALTRGLLRRRDAEIAMFDQGVYA